MNFVYKILTFVFALSLGLEVSAIKQPLSPPPTRTASPIVRHPATTPVSPRLSQQIQPMRPQRHIAAAALQRPIPTPGVPEWFITLIKPGALTGLIVGMAVMMKTSNILDTTTPLEMRNVVLGGIYGCIAGTITGVVTTAAIISVILYKHLKPRTE